VSDDNVKCQSVSASVSRQLLLCGVSDENECQRPGVCGQASCVSKCQ